MRTRSKLLLVLVALFTLSGCGTSNIAYVPQHLTLSMDEKRVSLPATLVKQKLENYNNLYITQRVLRLDDGSLVVYEDAKTDELYEFENTTTWITSVVFDAKKIYKVYTNSHLYAYQLLLQNNQILNLIVQQDDTQALRFIYGMSTKKLNEIVKSLDAHSVKAYYKDVVTIEDVAHALWSRWTVRKIHFTPLIVPLRQTGGAGG